MYNDLFLKALDGLDVQRPPVWLMRQAGRYMASYRALRKKHDFLTICRTQELIAEVTTLPITQFGFDAAIVFSDILLIFDALDIPLTFAEGQGPIIDYAIDDFGSLADKTPNMEYLFVAIRQLKKSLLVPLLGFAGAPFTLASYLIDGKPSNMQKTKQLMFQDEERFAKLLDILSEHVIWLLNKQIEAGVDAVQIFDSWAHTLPAEYYERFCLQYLEKIVKRLKPCPVIIFCKGDSAISCARFNPAAISFDWHCNLLDMRKRLPQSICVQGNIDPDILLAQKSQVVGAARSLLESMKGQKGFICNLGHGILPQTPEENVHALVECVQHA